MTVGSIILIGIFGACCLLAGLAAYTSSREEKRTMSDSHIFERFDRLRETMSHNDNMTARGRAYEAEAQRERRAQEAERVARHTTPPMPPPPPPPEPPVLRRGDRVTVVDEGSSKYLQGGTVGRYLGACYGYAHAYGVDIDELGSASLNLSTSIGFGDAQLALAEPRIFAEGDHIKVTGHRWCLGRCGVVTSVPYSVADRGERRDQYGVRVEQRVGDPQHAWVATFIPGTEMVLAHPPVLRRPVTDEEVEEAVHAVTLQEARAEVARLEALLAVPEPIRLTRRQMLSNEIRRMREMPPPSESEDVETLPRRRMRR